MMQLFDSAGQRKYLTPVQRQDFLRAAKEAPEAVYTFCATLAHTGCRLSEALALTGRLYPCGKCQISQRQTAR